MDLCPTDALERTLADRGDRPRTLGNAFNEDHLIAAFRGKRSAGEGRAARSAASSRVWAISMSARRCIAPASRPCAMRAASPHRGWQALVPIIREVLAEAIEAGGSSLRDYRQADGELGYFQHNFRVYGREGETCQTPGCEGIIRRTVQSGRSSFHCATCQR
jgi:formamidopyrimidine-DNA glycosylase